MVQEPKSMTRAVTPEFQVEQNTFISFDGAQLGLTTWAGKDGPARGHVVVGLHGMSDYANAFHMAAPYWADQGVTVYAYDQRGFGRSPERGIWPEEELMREDLRTAVAIARQRHPDATITVVGISMGAAVAISAFGSDRPPEADNFIASGPGLRGWGAMNPAYRASLWLSAHVRPSWIVRPPRRFVRIEPSDNIEMLQRSWADPLMMPSNRIDQVYGLVSLMETAHQRAPGLPARLPTLMSYGANDYVVPVEGVKRTAKVLPSHVRTVYYEQGYHMLLRDLQAGKVHDDYLAFMLDPEAQMPSGAPEWPFR
jgi:acylglycerol lipase